MIVKLKCKKELQYGCILMYEKDKYYPFKFDIETKTYLKTRMFPIVNNNDNVGVLDYFYTPSELRKIKIKKLLQQDDNRNI